MSKFSLFIGFLFICITSQHTVAQEWMYNFKEAKALAQEKNENIVLLFTGSDWCPPCLKLEKKILSSPEFNAFAAKKFVWVKADFPKRKKNQLSKAQQAHNEKLAAHYNKKMVFPVLLVLDPQGTVLGATGYRKMAVDRYIKLLNTFDSFNK